MKRWIVFWAKALVSGVLVYVVAARIAQMPELANQDFTDRLLSVHGQWFALALGALFISHLVNIQQWKELLCIQKVDITYAQAFKLFFVGLFFNSFMLGNAGGDVKKVIDIKQKYDSLGGGFTATVFDRLFGLFFLNLLSLSVGVLFFLQDESLRYYLLPSFWVFCGFAGILAGLFSRRFNQLIQKFCMAFKLGKLQVSLQKMIEHFYRFRNVRLWGHLVMYSLFIQVLRVLVHYCIARGLGITIDVSYFLFFIPIVAIVSALPVSFGGFGPREAVAQYLFALVGVSVMDSVVVQLLAYGAALLISLMGLVFFLKTAPATQTKIQ